LTANVSAGSRASAKMGMKRTLDVLNAMEADGIIGRYALAGAVAAYNYIEPAVTEDVDILVALERDSGQEILGLISLAPIFSYLKAKGYEEFRREGIVIEGWPVQFLPVTEAWISKHSRKPKRSICLLSHQTVS
jgi:hypothetical protein